MNRIKRQSLLMAVLIICFMSSGTIVVQALDLFSFDAGSELNIDIRLDESRTPDFDLLLTSGMNCDDVSYADPALSGFAIDLESTQTFAIKNPDYYSAFNDVIVESILMEINSLEIEIDTLSADQTMSQWKTMLTKPLTFQFFPRNVAGVDRDMSLGLINTMDSLRIALASVEIEKDTLIPFFYVESDFFSDDDHCFTTFGIKESADIESSIQCSDNPLQWTAAKMNNGKLAIPAKGVNANDQFKSLKLRIEDPALFVSMISRTGEKLERKIVVSGIQEFVFTAVDGFSDPTKCVNYYVE